MNFSSFLASLNTKTDSLALCAYSEKIDHIDFLKILNTVQNSEEQYFYWNKGSENFAFLALDTAVDLSVNGKHRTEKTDLIVASLLTNFQHNFDDSLIESLPVFIGGMTFSYGQRNDLWKNYNDSDWFIPRYLLIRYEQEFYYIYFFINDEKNKKKIKQRFENGRNVLNQISPEANDIKSKIVLKYESPFSKWKQSIEELLDEISKGTVQKVVLSRYEQYELDSEIPIANLLKKLENRYPECYIFCYRKGDSIFFGASPEKLANIRNSHLEADALAGSLPRGKNIEEDTQLGDELLSSEKNLAEQQAVVDFILHSISEFTENKEYNSEPILKKLPNIQHLWTSISAKLNADISIMSILKHIHPTPAICGVPWTTARKKIIAIEPYKRGLYTGLVGWFGLNQNAEFAVAIRSALLQGKDLYAFSGCGIVAGSDPDIEFNESKLKLKPILSLFDLE